LTCNKAEAWRWKQEKLPFRRHRASLFMHPLSAVIVKIWKIERPGPTWSTGKGSQATAAAAQQTFLAQLVSVFGFELAIEAGPFGTTTHPTVS